MKISGNTLREDVLRRNIFLEGMDHSELKITDKEFTIQEKKLEEILMIK